MHEDALGLVDDRAGIGRITQLTGGAPGIVVLGDGAKHGTAERCKQLGRLRMPGIENARPGPEHRKGDRAVAGQERQVHGAAHPHGQRGCRVLRPALLGQGVRAAHWLRLAERREYRTATAVGLHLHQVREIRMSRSEENGLAILPERHIRRRAARDRLHCHHPELIERAGPRRRCDVEQIGQVCAWHGTSAPSAGRKSRQQLPSPPGFMLPCPGRWVKRLHGCLVWRPPSGKLAATFRRFAVGSASIAGVPPFNGYVSLSLIHGALLSRHEYLPYAVVLIAQVITIAALGKAAWLAFFRRRADDYGEQERLRPG